MFSPILVGLDTPVDTQREHEEQDSRPKNLSSHCLSVLYNGLLLRTEDVSDWNNFKPIQKYPTDTINWRFGENLILISGWFYHPWSNEEIGSVIWKIYLNLQVRGQSNETQRSRAVFLNLLESKSRSNANILVTVTQLYVFSPKYQEYIGLNCIFIS